jgi:hypothetical protein
MDYAGVQFTQTADTRHEQIAVVEEDPGFAGVADSARRPLSRLCVRFG